MNYELRPAQYACELLSGGPKNYAYRTIDTVTGRTDTDGKFRDITLNFNIKQLVNFDFVGNMILGTGESTVTVHTEKNIKRN